MSIATRAAHSLRRRWRRITASPTWLRGTWGVRSRLWSVTGAPVVCLTHQMRNWGDALNHYLLDRLVGAGRAQYIDIHRQWPVVQGVIRTPIHVMVGSILQHADEHCVVWGAGLMSADMAPSAPPAEILAVRGPLTRATLERSGIACPGVFGDPALLMPRLYNPAEARQCHRLGVIPHYVDRSNAHVQRIAGEDGCTRIDIEAATEALVDRVCQCEAIASSSLHGLIVAQAYGVPGVWMRLSDRLEGGNFKFHDYYGSLGREDVEPVNVDDGTTAAVLRREAVLHEMPRRLDELARACPVGRIA